MTFAEIAQEIDVLKENIDGKALPMDRRNRLIGERLALVRLQWEMCVPPQTRKQAMDMLAVIHKQRRLERDKEKAKLERKAK